MLKALILSAALLPAYFLPASMFADLEGRYHVSGFDPKTKSKYTGVVIIEKQDSVYLASWKFSDGSTDTATGVKEGEHLSFVFNESSSDVYGTQLYKIEDDTLKGPWIRFGAPRKGFEQLKK